jgi:hypothetical protein
MRTSTLVLAPLVLLAGCGEKPEVAREAPPPAAANAEVEAPAPPPEIEVPAPPPPMGKVVTLACPEGAKQITETRKDRNHTPVAKLVYMDAQHRRQGPYVEFDDRGQVAEEGAYLDNVLDGTWTQYRSNGQIKQQGQYARGVMVKTWRDYYASGKLDAEIEYVDNNNLSMTAYTERGKLKARGSTVDGQSDGEWTWYDEGEPIETVIYALCKPVKAWSYNQGKRVPLALDKIGQ